MGLIRLLLAVSVVIAHSTSIFGLNFIGGQLAVEVFFIISGFYMALILSEKYNKNTNHKYFLTNRLLKIFPVYFFTLILCLIFELIRNRFSSNIQEMSLFHHPGVEINLFSYLGLIISNLIILGQDFLLFLGINPQTGLFFYTTNFRLHEPALYNFILIPQAWTLSLELVFYFLAPFLVKLKNTKLLVIISLSLILRLTIYNLGLNHDPWTYRFFPTELIYFIFGIIAYRIYKQIEPVKINKKLLSSLLGFYIFYITFYQFIPHNRAKMLVLFTLTIFLLPFIFKLSKNIKIDRFLGELSYPVYISHFLIINVFTHLIGLKHDYLGIFSVLLTILVSIIILNLIIKPIDNIRQKRIIVSNV